MDLRKVTGVSGPCPALDSTKLTRRLEALAEGVDPSRISEKMERRNPVDVLNYLYDTAIKLVENSGDVDTEIVCVFSPPATLDDYVFHDDVDFP